jgi:aryl-alcohol dehydrogenase-like predicted oxidoreductase
MAACGTGLLPYLPLAAGMLTGRYHRGEPIGPGARLSRSKRASRYREDWVWPIVEELERFCADRGRSLLELAFGWLLACPAVSSVIAGASSMEQIRRNVDSIGWNLNDAELAEVDRITGSVAR